ncbi:hypothetical protein EVAR_16129_1 [Eumeta japonica]|uniref:Uncharacterized protein n=1 Tax=Eumeta variegata TaxID=151549 RepID=A0A4C1UIM1_EUMVA|nr:hypothetical protein EVAR_16129_1 [Eumeta japonica]
MKRLMDVIEVREICKGRTTWKPRIIKIDPCTWFLEPQEQISIIYKKPESISKAWSISEWRETARFEREGHRIGIDNKIESELALKSKQIENRFGSVSLIARSNYVENEELITSPR